MSNHASPIKSTFTFFAHRHTQTDISWDMSADNLLSLAVKLFFTVLYNVGWNFREVQLQTGFGLVSAAPFEQLVAGTFAERKHCEVDAVFRAAFGGRCFKHVVGPPISANCSGNVAGLSGQSLSVLPHARSLAPSLNRSLALSSPSLSAQTVAQKSASMSSCAWWPTCPANSGRTLGFAFTLGLYQKARVNYHSEEPRNSLAREWDHLESISGSPESRSLAAKKAVLSPPIMNRRDGQQHSHKRGDVGLSVVAASRGTIFSPMLHCITRKGSALNSHGIPWSCISCIVENARLIISARRESLLWAR